MVRGEKGEEGGEGSWNEVVGHSIYCDTHPSSFS